MQRIAIIGTGNMGRVLGLSLASKGYEVFFGARNLDQARLAHQYNTNTKFGSNDDAAKFGEILYYSPRDIHPKDVISDLSLLDNKIVIESNN